MDLLIACEITEIRQALADKQEQENTMLQILMRVEQEQKVTEDARIFANRNKASLKIEKKKIIVLNIFWTWN
ncbi:hypothetical protein ACS0TY_019144 [Phlomoides rotata]